MQLPPQHLAEVVAALRGDEGKGGAAGKEQRRAARSTIAARVTVTRQGSGRSFTALTRDVSVGGLGLLQSTKLERGQTFTVSLPRARSVGTLALQCRVTHARELADGVWFIGAQFAAFGVEAKPLDKALEDEAARIRQKMLA